VDALDLSLIRQHVRRSRQQERVAVSVWITSLSVGGAIGTLMGGVLMEWFWWGGSVFCCGAVMDIAAGAGHRCAAEFR